MKIATIIGARPQFIKAAELSKGLRKEFEEIIIHTGQHYDYELDKVFFEELGVPEPKYNLGVGSGNHGKQTGKMLEKIEEILINEKPDMVLVYGDTNSTLAGALAAAKLHMPTAHVEAGLRSFDKRMPEEINRILTDHVSSILFCPTETAVNNLKKEGVTKGVYLTGDVMVDLLLESIKIANEKSEIMKTLKLENSNYILLTLHREENTNSKEKLSSIIKAMDKSGEKIIFPAHPRTIKYLKQYGMYDNIDNSEKIKIISPVGYFDMIILEKNAKKIITDSGGMQKEAYILKIPCITLRESTEWMETIEDGWNVLVGSDESKILNSIKKFNPNEKTHKKRFGDGKSAERIVDILKKVMEL
ncbi:MAG: UDP-N-acetylglucosamine 2-epimerase (non-hydrolyzing) [Candidatus ainarchaeum sp.]|nr:UDP-N-acetylglucosamine 2-epimerase (non-hydrolyzing) [Candidatus ainarchaeum sp.]